VVVTTTWGTYDPNVTAEILSYAPDQVIIIGGPAAVVDEYVTDLGSYNITVYRWWGANRYETDLAVLGNASKLFGIKFNASVVVAGNDSLAIQTALKLALQNRAVIVYVNQSTNVSKLMEKFRVKEMVMVQSGVSEGVMKKVAEELKSCNCITKEVRANVTEEEVERLMEQVRERLMAIEEIANMTNSTQLKERVREMLQLMEQVNQSIQSGNYTGAYMLALKLQARTEFALKDAHVEMEMCMEKNRGLALEMELQKLQAQVQMLEKVGVDVSAITPVLEQIKEAIQKGDYTEAKLLIKEVKKLIEEAFRGSRDVIKRHGSHGGSKH
jgi:putative cell wall-binding protein